MSLIDPAISRGIASLMKHLSREDRYDLSGLILKFTDLSQLPDKWQIAIQGEMAKNAVIKSVTIEKANPYHDDKGRFTTGGDGSGGGAVAGAGQPVAETDNYRMRHQAPRRADEFGSPATDIGSEMMPGFYEKPQLYSTGFPEADKESVAALMSIKGKPNAPVTIYRAVPDGVNNINAGDWVTLSPTYAKQHKQSNILNGGKVLSKTIPAKDLWFDGDSINEFGYDPVD
jgi:hypothetical protein